MKAKYHSIFDPRNSVVDAIEKLMFTGIWFSGPIFIPISIAEFKKRKSSVFWGHDINLIPGHTQSWELFSRKDRNAKESGYGTYVRMIITLQLPYIRCDLFLKTTTLLLWLLFMTITIWIVQSSNIGILFVASFYALYLINFTHRDLQFYKKSTILISEIEINSQTKNENEYHR